MAARPALRRRLTGSVASRGSYLYLPFEVPDGANRLDVRLHAENSAAGLGLGVFDPHGPEFGSPGFRGVCGAERDTFFLTADAATDGFLPGPLAAGRWTLLVPAFSLPSPTAVHADVVVHFGPGAPPVRPEPAPGVLVDVPGWYRGDLHCHTTASSDAWATGSSLGPADWARAAAGLGMDFLALTDHNVVSQNLHLRSDMAAADDRVLLLAGEEMTDWFAGHATVCGIEPGQWLDFRLSPDGEPRHRHGGCLVDFLDAVRELGGFVSAAHPRRAGTAWRYQREMSDPRARTDGYEVWNGLFQEDDAEALASWEAMLRRGWRIPANGGSDLHGTDNTVGAGVGTPTTVVYAERLAPDALLVGLRAGRSFVTRRPDGVDCYLSVEHAGGTARLGDTVSAAADEPVQVTARVLRGTGMRLRLLTGAGLLAESVVTQDDETVSVELDRSASAAGYVRAEVRAQLPGGRRPGPPGHPGGYQLDLECLTNPVWFAGASDDATADRAVR